MTTIVATSKKPFRYKGRDYTIVRAGISDGVAYATVSPTSAELESEICARLEDAGIMTRYLGPGYDCFPEDYPQSLRED